MTVRNANQRLSESRRNAVWLIAGLLLSVALLFAANWEANRQEQVRMDAFRSRVNDLAKISQGIIIEQLRQFDDVLLVLRRVYAADPKRFIKSIGLLRNGPLANREILVVLVDRDGYLAYTDSTTAKPGLSLGDRAYFRYFADGGKDRFYVDEPALGRATQRYTIPLVRPIYDKKGAFLGVIALSVRQESLANFGARLQLSDDTAVTLITHSGAVAGRSRDLAKMQGKIIPPEMLAPMQKGTEGVFSGRVIPDGVERVVAYRHIHDGDTPLIVYVEASPANALRETSQQWFVLIGGAGLLSLIIMVMIAVSLKGRKTTALLIDALRRSKEQEYETLTQASLDGFWITDSAGRILDTNDTFCKMLGYRREELLCLSIRDFEAVESPEEIADHIRPAMEAGSDRFQSRCRRKDGSIIDVEVSVQYIKESGGLFFVFIQDISERKQAEEALQTEKANLDAIFESSPVALFILDETTNIVRVNTAALVLTGGSAAAALQHRPGNALRCVHVSQDPRGCGYAPACPLCPARNSIESLLAKGGEIHGAELKMELMRNGAPEQVWMAIGAETVQLDGRRHVCIAMEDITARKQVAAINTARLHLIEFAAAHSLDELLEETLNEAEKLSGSVIGFYHFVEADQATLTLQNWSTRTKAEFCRAEGKGAHYGIDKAGVWVDCVHQRKPVIHNDYASLPHRKGMPEGHAVVIRQLVVPVMQGERVMAILGVGNKPDDYTPVDVAVVSELAGLAWQIAVRKRAEEALIQSRKAALNLMMDAVAARDRAERAEEEIKKQLDELFRWHNATLGRESRILDLKREVNELLGKAGDPPRYPSAESQDKKEE
jgi:PAS domain S-box-containing protein